MLTDTPVERNVELAAASTEPAAPMVMSFSAPAAVDAGRPGLHRGGSIADLASATVTSAYSR